MSRDVAPHIDDGNLIIDDIIIASEDEVAGYSQTQQAAVNGRDTYRIEKTDGTIYEVSVVGGGTSGGGSGSGGESSGGGPLVLPMGELDSTSTSTVMTATVPGITELTDGMACYIKNNVVTSASGWTLDVNDLGALPVYSSQTGNRATTSYTNGCTMMFIYNATRIEGGCWDMYYGYYSDAIGYQLRRGAGAYKAKSVVYRYMMLLAYSETEVVPINNVSNDRTTTKTLTTDSFDPFGPILYYYSTTTVNAGESVSVSQAYDQYNSIDLRYSFNEGQTLTQGRDVFIVCVPQSDGRAKLASSPIAQSLPSTDDGLLYILLGRATSTYQITLVIKHPIYYYKAGALRQWTNAQPMTDVLRRNKVSFFYSIEASGTDMQQSSTGESSSEEVFFFENTGTFGYVPGGLITSGVQYYSNWANHDEYTEDDFLPIEGKLYYCISNRKLYTWNGSSLVAVIGDTSLVPV